MAHHTVHITNTGFSPDPIQAQVNDTIQWQNDDTTVHTATSDEPNVIETNDIPAGQPSPQITLTRASDHSGFTYFCEYHPSMMTGTVFVAEAAAQASSSYTVAEWKAMAQIIAASWVHDQADDFTTAIATLPAADAALVQTQLDAIQTWWQGQTGSAPQFTDKAFLLAQTRERLDEAGKRFRTAWMNLRPRVVRAPNPNHAGNNGQSQDPLGKAITIFGAPQAELDAFGREIRYAIAAFGIERLRDNGIAITPAQRQAYQTAKGNVTAADYELLAIHQVRGLRNLFGADAFDAAAFTTGMWRLTDAGEWDDPPFSIWHWLRWIDAYLGVVATGNVPDIIPPP
jgi:plastocyanin